MLRNQIPSPLGPLVTQESPTSPPPLPSFSQSGLGNQCRSLTITLGVVAQLNGPFCCLWLVEGIRSLRSAWSSWVRLIWFNKLENSKKVQQSWRTRSPGSDSRRNPGGRSAVQHLCTRVRTAEEADGFSQDGGIHRWQLWAALQWSCG